MADSQLPEDEAILYVLGELPASRRAEFEAHLAVSRELSALVRELEEGAVALATASPPRRPPPQVWANIDKVLRRDTRRGTMLSAFRIGWWRNGWAVALASVVGWVLYAIFINVHHGSPAALRETTVATVSPTTENTVSKPPLPAVSNANVKLLRVRTEEISDLRLKIAQLEKETGQLSQLVVQQRTMLAESNRIKFFQFSPTSNTSSEAVAAPLSPELQRAVFMSIGQQLGWLRSESKSPAGVAAGGHATVNTLGGVDFVDLRPPKNDVGNPNPSPTQQMPPPATSAQQTPAQQETGSQPGDVTEPAIPAFVSGDKLVVALDPSMVPPNSSLTFGVRGFSLGTTDGSFVMGSNPAVVTMPFSLGNTMYDGGFYLTVGTTTLQGQSVTTQFFVPATP